MRIAALCLAALALLVPAGNALGDLIYNGSFELGNVGFTTQYTYGYDLCVSGTIVVGNDPHNYCPRAASYGDHTTSAGRMLIVNGAPVGNVTIWEQTVSVTPNTEYLFFYWLSNWTDDDVRLAEIRCRINGASVGLGIAPPLAGEWTVVFHRWHSGASTQATIRLVDESRAEVCNDFALDDIGMIEIGNNRVLVVSSTQGGSVFTPGEGFFLYPDGETLWLGAKCEPGYEFAGWTGNFGDAAHLLWVQIDGDYRVKAEFRKPDYDVMIAASGSAPNEFTTCDEAADRLTVLRGALASGYGNGVVLGERQGVCDATYLFPIFRPQAGATGPAKITVNVYGSAISVGAVVRIGNTGPYWPQSGDLHQTFTGAAVPALLGRSDEPVYWLPVQIDAIMGACDVAGVYVSYDCPGVPRSLLRRFHDHLSICQALAGYAQDPSIRSLYSLKAGEERIWEAVLQTMALTEDLAGADSALQRIVHTGVEELGELLGLWPRLTGGADLTALAGCGCEAILACLDSAAASGPSYLAAYADALGDGRVWPEEAADLNQRMAEWKADLADLNTALSRAFDQLGELYRQAEARQDRRLRDTTEKMIRAMTPWCTGKVDDFGFWDPGRPSYLEEVIRSLQDFPAQDISLP
jgi:hypothetical protein